MAIIQVCNTFKKIISNSSNMYYILIGKFVYSDVLTGKSPIDDFVSSSFVSQEWARFTWKDAARGSTINNFQ